jgi:hypothetical protein
MNMKKYYVLLTVFLLVFIGITPAYANGSEHINTKIEFNEAMDTQGNKSTTFRNIKISASNGNIIITGKLAESNKVYDINLSGNIYPILEDSSYANKLMLGELEGNEFFDVSSLRIEKDSRTIALSKNKHNLKGKTVLTLIIKDKQSGQEFILQEPINPTKFDTLLDGSSMFIKNIGIKDDELKQKILDLYNQGRKNIVTESNDKDHKEVQSADSSSENTEVSIASGSYVSHSALDNVLRDVKSQGTIDLDNYEYSNVPKSIFSEQGWKDYDNYSNPEFFYHAYTSATTYDSMTQISMVDVVSQFLSSPTRYEVQTTVRHGLMLEYDQYTHELSVFFYDYGLDFQNLKLAANNLNDRNVFISNYTSGVLNNSPSYVKGLGALIPYWSTASSVWDGFSITQTQRLNTEYSYDNTYDKQYSRYNGSVIRGVQGNFSGYSMSREGQWAKVRGEIYKESTATLIYGYSYTADKDI